MNLSSRVPEPWTPLSIRGNTIHCWGREYRIQGALPRQILSQGEPLLAGPIRFLSSDGEPLIWTPTPVEGQARLAKWNARAQRGKGKQHARITIEYDGFYQVDVDLGTGLYRELTLEIPIASRHARYLHFVNETHYQEQNTLALSPRDGEIWKNRFACMVWAGDERVGLAWCADTDAPFRLRQPDRALSIYCRGSTTTLRIRLIDHPVTLTKPLRWRFGLIATPVRPLPPGWRDWRLSPGPSANMHILWWNSWAGSHADPVPKDVAALTEQARQIRAKREYLLPYVAPQALSERSAIYRERGGSRWRREPLSQLGDEGTPYWIVCPNTPWKDAFAKQMEYLCGPVGVNGLYFDFTFPYRCQAAHHPCGNTDAAGALRRGAFQVFALRKLAQETYERVKAVNPDARILMHTSGALMYPYIGFSDLMLNGEQLRQPLTKAEGHYMNVLPLETLRAEYRGQHSGLAPFLIPEMATPEGMPDPRFTATPGPTQEMLALTLLHDIGVWPIYCHLETVEAVRQAQRQFGTAEARFLPYWEKGGPVTMDKPSLLASAWSKPSGVLLVVANRGETPVETRLQPRPSVGPGRRGQTFDALTRDAVAGNAADMTITVPARGFRLLRLSPVLTIP